MKVELKAGEAVIVEFEETDGEVEVRFDSDAIRVRADDEPLWTEELWDPETAPELSAAEEKAGERRAIVVHYLRNLASQVERREVVVRSLDLTRPAVEDAEGNRVPDPVTTMTMGFTGNDRPASDDHPATRATIDAVEWPETKE